VLFGWIEKSSAGRRRYLELARRILLPFRPVKIIARIAGYCSWLYEKMKAGKKQCRHGARVAALFHNAPPDQVPLP
jgi:hypothetical protein